MLNKKNKNRIKNKKSQELRSEWILNMNTNPKIFKPKKLS